MSFFLGANLSLAERTSLTHTVGKVPAQSWDGNSLRDIGALGSGSATSRSWGEGRVLAAAQALMQSWLC